MEHLSIKTHENTLSIDSNQKTYLVIKKEPFMFTTERPRFRSHSYKHKQ